jgi:hypothetical protein
MRQPCFLKQSLNEPDSRIDEGLTVNFTGYILVFKEPALGLYCMLTKRRAPFTEEAKCVKFTTSRANVTTT